MTMKNSLSLLEKLTEDPHIVALVKKAKLVKLSIGPYAVLVWTSDKAFWEIRKTRSGDIYCTCPAYRFNKSDPRTCKHLMAVSAMLQEEEIPIYIPEKLR